MFLRNLTARCLVSLESACENVIRDADWDERDVMGVQRPYNKQQEQGFTVCSFRLSCRDAVGEI